MTYRIQRSTNARGVTFFLSGEMDSGHVAELEALMAAESDRLVILDLADVTLVNREAISFWRAWKRRVPSLSTAPSTCAVGSTRSRSMRKRESPMAPVITNDRARESSL